MRRLMLYLRNNFHPLFHLRNFSIFQRATRLLDVPIAIRFKDISHPVYVSFSKNLSWVLSGGESAEEVERQNFIWLTKTGGFKRFLDVGANIGLYGFLFGTVAGDANVTLIEPDLANAKLIRKTILASDLPATLVEAAVSDVSGVLTFYKDDLTGATGSLVRSADDSFIATHHRLNPTAVSVRAVTLDEICPVESPDFIKIDVEGAELKALRGGETVLSRSRPGLMFECDEDREAMRDFLHGRGYVFFDMESLAAVDTITHNCLALHRTQHGSLIAAIAGRQAGSAAMTA
jgi:FkbM family methyltransferase